MADKLIKEYTSSLYRAYEHLSKTTQDALDLLSAHSTAGCAIVMVIKTAAMLFKVTLAIELCYHFRPYHWMIMNSSAYLISLGLMFIGRGTLFICSVISLPLRVILQYLWLACYGLVKLIVMLVTHLTSAIVYTVSFVLNIVSRFLITTLPITVMNPGRDYWQYLTFRVIIAIVVISLAMLLWRHYKWRNDGKEPAGSPTDELNARLTDSEFSFEAEGQTKSPVAFSLNFDVLIRNKAE